MRPGKIKILFIVPLNEPYRTIVSMPEGVSKYKRNKNIKKLNTLYPSGVLSISAYVKKNYPDAEIKIIDFNIVLNRIAGNIEQFNAYVLEDFLREALSLLGGFTPDIIGISALFCSVYQDLAPLAAFLRNAYPGSIVVCGGHLASTLYERACADDVSIDGLAFGEGEIPFLELVRAVSSGTAKEYLSSSASWITKDKCGPGKTFTPQARFIVDLDEIPPYDLDVLLFPDVYFDASGYLFMPQLHEYEKEMVIFSTRGCPNQCVFCASHQVHGRKVRLYSVDRVKSDMLYYHEKYGIKRFVFYDDHFLYKRDRALEILNFIPEKNLLACVLNPAFFSIDESIAAAMKRAGVKSCILSIENGNEKTFKHIIRKPSSLKKANEAVEMLHKEGINVAANILLGLPGETPESIDAGQNYLLTTNFNWFQCFVAAPLPGSDLYKICVENNYFIENEDILAMDFKKCVIRTKDFEPHYIENKAYEMNLRLNFVNNYDLRSGNYQTALMLFEKVIHNVMNTHAFAYYYAAKCCKALGEDAKYNTYRTKYQEVVSTYSFWREWAARFNLEELA